MVGVRVRHDHRVDTIDAERAKGRHHRGGADRTIVVRATAAVDEHGLAVGEAQGDRVPVADVQQPRVKHTGGRPIQPAVGDGDQQGETESRCGQAPRA